MRGRLSPFHFSSTRPEVKNVVHAGKNAVRVVRKAHPDVTDLFRLGFTSVHDAMQVMDLPASVQQEAEAEVRTWKSTRQYFFN